VLLSGFSPQSIRILLSGVERRNAALPTSLQQPSMVTRTHASLLVTSRWIRRPMVRRNCFRSSFTDRRNCLTCFTVELSIGGVLTTLGVHPICFVISRSVAPFLPMTTPGFSASMSTSPVSASKKISVIPAFSATTSRISSIARSGSSSTFGLTTIRFRRSLARILIRSASSANRLGSSV